MRRRAILITVATILAGTCQPAAGHDGADDHPSNDVEVLQPPAPVYPALAAASALKAIARCGSACTIMASR